MSNNWVRLNEEMLLGQARELLAQPAPDLDNFWETTQRIGKLKYYVTELAAALELRRKAELPRELTVTSQVVSCTVSYQK